MKRGIVYILILAVTAALMAPVAFEASLIWSLTRCDDRAAAPDAFLAECNAIGNYEHGAFFYGLEPEGVEHLREADVVFLGDSHLQYAFSTDATDAFFAANGISHYLLGFGYGEGSAFIAALARHQGLHPRALVIDANPFFADKESIPAGRILGLRGPLTRIEYSLKARAIVLAKALCDRFGRECGGKSPTIYRTRASGHWRVGGFDTHRKFPLRPGTKPPSPALLDEATRAGVRFLEAMSVAPSCVILTGIPDGEENLDAAVIAATLARRLGTQVLNVAVPDMRSIDGSHMTRETARRWSEAFFAQLGPLLADCGALKMP